MRTNQAICAKFRMMDVFTTYWPATTHEYGTVWCWAAIKCDKYHHDGNFLMVAPTEAGPYHRVRKWQDIEPLDEAAQELHDELKARAAATRLLCMGG